MEVDPTTLARWERGEWEPAGKFVERGRLHLKRAPLRKSERCVTYPFFLPRAGWHGFLLSMNDFIAVESSTTSWCCDQFPALDFTLKTMLVA
jgi:hypothetical protein